MERSGFSTASLSSAVLLASALFASASALTYSDRAGNGAPHDWSVLLEKDCDGSLHLFPTMPEITMSMGVDGRINQLFATLRDRALDQVRCHCPDLPEQQLLAYFDPSFGAVLNMVQNASFNVAELDAICTGATAFTLSLGTAAELLQEHDLTWNNTAGTDNYVASCTHSGFGTQGCRAAFETGVDGERLQVAIKECGSDRNKLPYISISGSGAMFENAFRPCNVDADCAEGGRNNAGMTCDSLAEMLFDDATLASTLEQLMTDLELYATAGSTCTGGLGTNMVGALMGHVGGMMGIAADASGMRKACGLHHLNTTVSSISDPDAGSLVAWDGILANGDYVFDNFEHRHLSANIDPERLVTPDCQASYDAGEVVPIVEHQCTGTHGGTGGVLLTPLSPFRAGIQPAQFQTMVAGVLVPWFTSIASQCGLNVDSLAHEYFVWQPGFWLRMAELGMPFTTPPSGTVKTLFTVLHEALGWHGTVELPSSCTLAEWESTGTCRLQFGNLTSLLGFPENSFTLRVTLSRCSDVETEDAFPYIYVDCVGSHCKQVLELYSVDSCTSDADCKQGDSCSSFEGFNIFGDDAGLLPKILWNGTGTDTCGDAEDDVFSAISVARAWSGNPAPFTPAEKSAASWCEPQLLSDQGSGSAVSSDDFFDNLLVWDAGTRVYSMRGVEAWAPAPTGADGCALGIKEGDGARVRQHYGPTVPTSNAVASLELTIDGDLTVMSEATQELLKEGIQNTVVAESGGSILHSDIRQVLLRSGSIEATVEFEPNRVSHADVAAIIEAIQSEAGVDIVVNGTSYRITGVRMVAAPYRADEEDNTGVIAGVVVGALLAVGMAIGAAVYYKRQQNMNDGGRQVTPQRRRPSGAKSANPTRRHSYQLHVENMHDAEVEATCIAEDEGVNAALSTQTSPISNDATEHAAFEPMMPVEPAAPTMPPPLSRLASAVVPSPTTQPRGELFKSVRRINPLSAPTTPVPGDIAARQHPAEATAAAAALGPAVTLYE